MGGTGSGDKDDDNDDDVWSTIMKIRKAPISVKLDEQSEIFPDRGHTLAVSLCSDPEAGNIWFCRASCGGKRVRAGVMRVTRIW